MAPFMLSHFSYVLFPQLLSRGGVDVPALLVKVTRAWETAVAIEAACAMAMLTTEDSALEAVAAQDSTALYVKDAEDRATLPKREALERVSRVEVENATVLASAREDVKGLAWKIALLEDELGAEPRAQEVSKREHREQFKELTLLQTRGSELCHIIVRPPWVRCHLTEGMQLVALRHTEMAGELAALRAAVSTAVESVLGRPPGDTFHVEVVIKMATKFQKMED
jgi:hypothetical protein